MTDKEPSIETESPPSPRPSPRPGALKSMDQVRGELARLYRDCRQGKVRPQDGARLTYMLVSLGKLIEEAAPKEEDQGTAVVRLVEIFEHGLADDEEAAEIEETTTTTTQGEGEEEPPAKRRYHIPGVKPDPLAVWRAQ